MKWNSPEEKVKRQKDGKNNRTVRLVIYGKVQGVFFRSNLKIVADNYSVTGWTRNLADGTVEALVQGTDANVKRVIDWCHVGPPSAQVTSVETTELDADIIYDSFAVLH